VAQLDRPPAAQRLVRPQWPIGPDRASASAEVLVDFVVGSDGQVYNAVVAHSTDRAFENSAVAAVSQWVFAPGQVSGQPVNTHMQVPIVFTPGAAPNPAPSADTWF
jgi:TonB family protein